MEIAGWSVTSRFEHSPLSQNATEAIQVSVTMRRADGSRHGRMTMFPIPTRHPSPAMLQILSVGYSVAVPGGRIMRRNPN
jgi:hypothetical protein